MRRQKLTVNDWSRIPTVTPENKSGYETRHQFYEREKREAEERANAPIRAAQQEIARNMAKLNKAVGAFWGQSISDLAVTNLWKSEAGVDLGFNVPTIRDSFTIEDLKNAYESWFVKYNGPHQFALGTREKPNRGAGRLVWYCVNQALNNKQDMSNEAAIDAAHQRLIELGAYGPDEIAYDASKAPVPQPEPEPAPTLTERQQVEKGFVNTVVPLLSEWVASLSKNFNGFRPSEADIEYLFGTNENSPNPQDRGFIWRANLAPYDRRTFDVCRRHMVDVGRWSEELLTADEKFARNLERMETPLTHLPASDRFTLASNLERLKR